MSEINAIFRCLGCDASYPLTEAVYSCKKCNNLLQIEHSDEVINQRSASEWKTLFDSRTGGRPGPYGSGVWRFHEWVLPNLPKSSIVTLGEGASPLVAATGLSTAWGLDIAVKQCGHSLSGSFKDLGMTVLMSQVNEMRRQKISVPAVACASTGDTSAALAAYGAAAGVRTLVLLPRGKITAAQLVQPLSHGARVIAIDTDFDGCMEQVQRLCVEEGVYLANSKNSLRIEGQKTVAFEICQGLGWDIPDWVAIPGGNLGNVSALAKGFLMLQQAGIISKLPRVLCAQAQRADPLYRSYQEDYAPLSPVEAQATQASAIRIGNPVSFPKAVAALKLTNGVVASVTEQELTEARVPYEVGQAFFKNLARAQITGDAVGMLKILFHRETRQILGIHCFGDQAAEIVHIGQAIMNQEGEANSLNYFINTTFNYPTMAEAYRVAALNGLNRIF